MCKILIADDDTTMLNMVEQVLTQEGYSVILAHSSDDVFEQIRSSVPDLFLIDLAHTHIDGLELCQRLRDNPGTADKPIIFLTNDHSAHKAAEALEAGGDDYVRKPFAVRELTARIRAHLRRFTGFEQHNIPSVRILPRTFQVFVDGREVSLTRIEFDLLTYMCSSPDHWFGTHELLGNVWNYPDGVGDSALVRNHIRNLRRKLESNPDHPTIVKSRHGRGYSIHAQIFINERPA